MLSFSLSPFLILSCLSIIYNIYIYYQVTAKGRNSDRIYTLKYEDGEVETIDLATERFRFLGGAKRSAISSGGGSSSGAGNANDQSKRRRINDNDEDSDEEFEFDDEVSDEDEGAGDKSSKGNRRPSMDDGSDFLASENDEEMDDDSEEEFEFDEDEDEEDSEDEEALMVTGELIEACRCWKGMETSRASGANIHSNHSFLSHLYFLPALNENQTRMRRMLDMELPAAGRRSRLVVVPKRRRRRSK